MAKRKRTVQLDAPAATVSIKDRSSKKVRVAADTASAKKPSGKQSLEKQPTTSSTSTKTPVTIQIITGSYDRILHGITATISRSDSKPASNTANSEPKVQFADTFLFNAHTSAIRTLALSPASAPVPKQTQKIILATGSSDERINLYHISAHAPTKISIPAIPSLTSRAVVENPSNRELGSLLHHGSAVTKLHFPNRGKLLSSAEDSTIAVTRTRDWSLLSTIKAPIPKAQGRPSGDTAPVGGAPSGVNDFAVHPSMKLMISVGKGEKCMRLWNLVTGKKAGALTFERSVLNEVGEGRFSSGEGRKVAWGGGDGEGEEEFCVVFERGIVVFGMDSKVRCKVVTPNKTKIHQVFYVNVGGDDEQDVLALSTEDGRVLFFSTRQTDLTPPTGEKEEVPSAKLIAQLGGKEAGITSRIKDFNVLKLEGGDVLITTAGSDGAVRIWSVDAGEMSSKASTKSSKDGKTKDQGEEVVKQVGSLLGMYETNNRVTCMASFVMLPAVEGVVDERKVQVDGGEDSESGSDTGSE